MDLLTLAKSIATALGIDPTYGYDLPALQKVPAPAAPPPDFAAFWKETYTQTIATPINASMHEIAGGSGGSGGAGGSGGSATHRTFEVDYTSLGGFRVGAWLTIPRDGIIDRALVIGHGYGGRAQPEPQPPAPRAAAIYPCARGMNRSARPDLPNTAPFHVLHGIESKETYIHRFCAADLWSAATTLTTLVPETAPCLEYLGESFGGGMGALAIPWDHRFRRATLIVPSFGNHPLRLTMPCIGSGQAVRLYHRHHPELLQVLSYFDAATAASHIHIPILCACARMDPAVPPPGQFSIYNAIPLPARDPLTSRDREGADVPPLPTSRDREGADVPPLPTSRDREGADVPPLPTSRDREGAGEISAQSPLPDGRGSSACPSQPPCKHLHILDAGHFPWPGETADRQRRDAAIAAWLTHKP